MVDFKEIIGANSTYIIGKELGSGATGKTYLVVRELDQKEFVLKWLVMESVEKWKVIDRFKREGEILKSMSFPGIPEYIELIEHEAGLGLIQSYIDGLSWQQQIDQTIPVHINQAEKQLTGLLQILNYLSSFHPPIIHRDISPKNIMVDQQGEIWLIDFGSVQAALHQHSKTVTTMGTFGYMAPEQIMGQARPQSDIFSLGMSLVARLTHTNPDNFILNDISGGVDLEKMGLELPPYFMAVVEQMVASGLETRFDNPNDALEQLENKDIKQLPKTIPVHPQKSIPKLVKPKKWYQKWRYRFAILLMMIFLGGYIASIIPANGEIKTYGGWFSGHGNLLASVTSTLVGDASAIGSPNSIRSVAFSPDGTKIASLARRGVIVQEKKSGKVLYENSDIRGRHFFFDPTGKQLWIQGRRGDVEAIDVKTGKKELFTSAESWMLQKEGVTTSVSCSEGLILRKSSVWANCYYGSGSQKHYFLIDLRSGETIKSDQEVGTLYFAGSDLVALVISGSSYLLKTWDFERKQFTTQHRVNVKNNGYSMHMVSGEVGNRFLIKISGRYFLINRDGETECIISDAGTSYQNAMAIHEGKGLIAVSGRETIEIYDMKMKKCNKIKSFAGHRRFTETLAFSPDGTELLSGGYDQTVKLWKIK